MITIKLEPQDHGQSAFKAYEGNEFIGSMLIHISGNTLKAMHTEVDHAHEGKGVAHLHLDKMVSYAEKDKRITTWHISLYAALVYYWEAQDCHNPFSIPPRKVMLLSHIHALPTYHKYMRELVQLGFIKYMPSYNPFLGSLVWLN